MRDWWQRSKLKSYYIGVDERELQRRAGQQKTGENSFKKMQLLQTYLHSPGLSQNPCCSSHPGKQMAARGKATGSSPPECFQHEGATSCAQRASEPAGPGIGLVGLYSARGAFFLTQQLKDKRARKPPPPQAPFLLREGQKSFPLLLPSLPPFSSLPLPFPTSEMSQGQVFFQ